MIPTLSQLLAGIRGGAKLMAWDRDAMKEFDLSIEGFWQSFFAPLAVLPIAIMITLAHLAVLQETPALDPEFVAPPFPGTGPYLIIQTLTYLVQIAVFPLVMALTVRGLDAAEHYVPLIISWNWVNALWICFFGLLHLLYLGDVVSLPALLGLRLVVLGFGILSLYFAIWTSFQTSPFVASVMLGLSIVLDLMVGEVASIALAQLAPPSP